MGVFYGYNSQKYGGSSVADKEKLDIICNNLIEDVNNGEIWQY